MCLLLIKVVCVLCAAKLDQPTSRINVCGSPLFPMEMEVRKLPIAEETCISAHSKMGAYVLGICTFAVFNLFASHLFLKSTICSNIWGQ